VDLTILIVAVIIAFAFFGESIFGFGGGLISIPLLSVLIGIKSAVTLVLIFQLLMGLLLWKSREHISWRHAKPMTISILLGTASGTVLLSYANLKLLQLFLAGSIVLFLAKSLFLKKVTFGVSDNATKAVSAGLGGGLFQGLIGTGGPILTMYLSVTISNKLKMRATLIYLFFITSVLRVGISLQGNLFNVEILKFAAWALGPFLLAIWFGHRTHTNVSDKYYKLGVYTVLALSATLLIAKTV
jgi:uncharacterized membrane protein YfcA